MAFLRERTEREKEDEGLGFYRHEDLIIELIHDLNILLG
jgi:hypothetical protein